MKSKKIIVFSVLVILGILFGITSCKNYLLDTKKTTININLDLSKLIKTSRSDSTQNTEYILKIFAYDAANYQDNAEIEKLPLITQSSNKVDISGIVKTSLEVPIDSNIIFEAQLFKDEDSNPLYAGKSEIITIKPQDNKVHLELTKTQTNVDIGITIENEEIFIIQFNSLGGSYVETQKVEKGKNPTIPTEPTKEGYIFEGWYTSSDYGDTLNTKFDFTSSITSDVTLFAKWKFAERFVFVQGASINGAITAEGYTESEIFKEGGIVSIPNFYISDHEVTQAEYKAIMGTWPDESMSNEEMKGVGDNHPVYYVSWFDTLVYCNKRSINEGLTPCYTINGSTNPDDWGEVPDSETHNNFTIWFNATCDFQANGYRLPTSAEWEYAARGGNGLTDYQYKYSGSNNIEEVAWISDSTVLFYEVRGKKNNALGLYDMSGNVYEWGWNITSETKRPTRGGSHYIDTNDNECTVFFNGDNTVWTKGWIGFRLVRTATEQSQGDVYSQGISLNGKIYDKTSEVVVVPKDTVAQIAMEDDSSWNTYYEGDDQNCKGVFLKDRKVQLSPFAMSQFEVTQELYELVLGENPSTYINNQSTDELVNLRPVDAVKWYDAVNFCNELTKITMGEEHCVYTVSDVVTDETNSYITNANVAIDLSKKGYRLPTEAEWEFAARGGNPASEIWKYAYAGVPANSNEINNYFWNDTDTTHEVGRKNSNSLGLYDMSSNMYEWTCDGYKQQVTITDEFIENPVVIPDENDKRFVVRGGNFGSEAFTKYVSYRHGTKSDTAMCGFRLVRTITE